ncbi:MAG TPA: NADH:flavin oxidoreductase/NADH oxidase [Castellaniella sp.]|nr:NADH:flavin oxidoreductase/NADH oxidase [Castellaniella sp.]
MSTDGPLLFQPLRLRGLTLANRIVISPMCQHAADQGHAGTWHLVHLGKFALGGAGLILTESTAVDPRGRIGIADLGLWQDSHIAALRDVVDFIHGNGGLIGIQLAHAGRKAGSQPLWEGGAALSEAQLAAAPQPLQRLGPSARPAGPGWTMPHALDPQDIAGLVQLYVDATRRAERAGADVVELHFGHGYLVASFLSPISNHREDDWGGTLDNRMRLALDIATQVRAAWPAHKPLFCRISAVDGAVGGWGLGDSVILARALAACGVDVIDCSSGGLSEETRALPVPRGLGFQVPFSERIRHEANVRTQAVGMIVDAHQAEAILARGQADLIALAREALYDPYWPLHAAATLGIDPEFQRWHKRYGIWLAKRAPGLAAARAAQLAD